MRFFARIESNSLNTYSSEINCEQEIRSQEESVVTFTVPWLLMWCPETTRQRTPPPPGTATRTFLTTATAKRSYFLSAFATVPKPTNSFVVSVQPCHNRSIRYARIFSKCDFFFFRKHVEKIQVSLKADKNNGYLTEHMRTFMRYRAEFFLEREMFQTKVVEKNKTHILCSLTSPPPKIVPFMR